MNIRTGPNLSDLILSVIEDEPLHGYAIAREIEKRSLNALRYGEGALYPALRSLEKGRFVEATWDTSGAGPARRVYRLTHEGVKELREARLAWLEYSHSVEQVLGGSKVVGQSTHSMAGGA
jgi:PadR family transcriptional regulator PadR